MRLLEVACAVVGGEGVSGWRFPFCRHSNLGKVSFCEVENGDTLQNRRLAGPPLLSVLPLFPGLGGALQLRHPLERLASRSPGCEGRGDASERSWGRLPGRGHCGQDSRARGRESSAWRGLALTELGCGCRGLERTGGATARLVRASAFALQPPSCCPMTDALPGGKTGIGLPVALGLGEGPRSPLQAPELRLWLPVRLLPWAPTPIPGRTPLRGRQAHWESPSRAAVQERCFLTQQRQAARWPGVTDRQVSVGGTLAARAGPSFRHEVSLGPLGSTGGTIV